MFKQLSMMLVGTIVLARLASGAVAQEKADKTDALAKEAAARFMKAMIAEDLDAVMKLADLPFFWDGVKNIKDREELKKGFAEIFAEKDLTQLNYQIKEVQAFAKVQQKMRAKERELLKDVLDKTDRIAVIGVKTKEGQDRDGLVLMIRLREGKPKIVGFRD